MSIAQSAHDRPVQLQNLRHVVRIFLPLAPSSLHPNGDECPLSDDLLGCVLFFSVFPACSTDHFRVSTETARSVKAAAAQGVPAVFVSHWRQSSGFPPCRSVNSVVSPVFPAVHSGDKILDFLRFIVGFITHFPVSDPRSTGSDRTR